MQGRSWKPLLTTRPADWRQSWFYEYFAENQKNSRVPDITAVRTTDAKLIRYMGHDEWTELFDLKNDPYETRNLFNDPAHAGLRARLEVEDARLAKETGYRVPDYTDRPVWWGKPGGPDWTPDAKPGLRLQLNGALEGKRAVDSSGLNNNGVASGVETGEGRDGRTAFRFNGAGYIEIARSESLDPSQKAWTVEVTAKPDKADGMLVAHGGRSQGYALWLREGKPSLTVVVGGRATTVAAREPVTGWATITGLITAGRKATLYVDGRLAGAEPLQSLIGHDPNEGMQIGADLGSPVVEPPPPRFTGSIESVRVSSGERTP
jgi:hypothetical protein